MSEYIRYKTYEHTLVNQRKRKKDSEQMDNKMCVNKLSKLLLTTVLAASLCCTAAFSAGRDTYADESDGNAVTVVQDDAAVSADSEDRDAESSLIDDETDMQADNSRTKYIMTGVVILTVGVAFYVVLHVKSKKEP